MKPSDLWCKWNLIYISYILLCVIALSLIISYLIVDINTTDAHFRPERDKTYQTSKFYWFSLKPSIKHEFHFIKTHLQFKSLKKKKPNKPIILQLIQLTNWFRLKSISPEPNPWAALMWNWRNMEHIQLWSWQLYALPIWLSASLIN